MNLYANNIMDHYHRPRNKENMADADTSARQLNQSCGDDISVFIKLQNQKIQRITFLGQGCAISQAAISILSEKLIGLSIPEIQAYSFENIKNILGVDISERRYNCAMLGLQAIQKALRGQADQNII